MTLAALSGPLHQYEMHPREVFIRFITSPLLIIYVIALHIMWGVMLVLYPKIAPPLVLLGGFQHLISLLGIQNTGIVLLSFASLAMVGIIYRNQLHFWASFWLLIPQYAVALYAALSSLEAIILGVVVTNSCGVTYMPPWQQTLLGTGPIVISGTLHTLYICGVFAKVTNPSSAVDKNLDYLRSENLRLHREEQKLREVIKKSGITVR